MSLVPIPWEPGLYIHPDMLKRLRAIEASLGRVPYLFGENSAWRSYAQQKAMWDAYQNGTGNVASNPDTGNRTHMRGVAVDLQDTSLAMQRACVRAGLQRDPNENWHWQLPNWADYPIILELPEEQDIDVKLIRRDGGTPEWSLFHPTLRGPSELERGYIVVTDPEIAKGLARTWADGFGTEKGEPRDAYVGLQASARWAYDRGAPKPSGSTLTEAGIAKAVNAELADDFAAVRADVNKPRTVQ
ncbi:D-alanyl-D-alanine carboxypeptidase [Pseudanabaena phage Pan2]|nr:D-alanyl-D-alanine carboxypeptidase [Pseudanabaena phage Pan2]